MDSFHPKDRPPSDSECINLLDLLEVIVKWKRMIALTTIFACLTAVFISLVLPKSYSSSAKILPPVQDQGLLAAITGDLGGLTNLMGGMLGKGSSADLYVGLLKSETIKDRIIDRFGLMKALGKRSRIETYGKLDALVTIEAGKKDGIITISVEDRYPKRAADIANAYVEELEELLIGLNVTGAGENRVYLEKYLASAKVDLAKAEDALKEFSIQNKSVNVSEQAKLSIESVAQLQGQLVAQEVQLATLRRQFTDSSQEVKIVQASIAALKSKISRIEGSRSSGVIPSVGDVPAIGQEYIRLMRDFKVKETLVELLAKQLEVAKLSEAKNNSAIQIVQKARVPDKKIKPKRQLLVIGVTTAALILSLLYAFVSEAVCRIPDEERIRLKELVRNLLYIKLNKS
ncbi:lipopolysaccharide biosynthesis protein [Geobacter sulfurreducens]|uniref:GumC family protein n=1 Tax=Geobacter sulfurreducens TaxID=35554 RepID=UPI001BDDA6B8|nr:Wzz/FepE/Etk N-terminal domain-containing protein [Geobacter sulfurreducens]QVW33813.1 lipopolysaccharide biosynthesis protein [Geobacter sulfurreducens]